MQQNKQEISPIKKRILQYIDIEQITKYEFYKKSGISRGILDQKTGISEDNIARFIAYTNGRINLEWLIIGKGDMFKNTYHTSEVRSQVNEPNLSEKTGRNHDELNVVLKKLVETQDEVINMQTRQINSLTAELDHTKTALKKTKKELNDLKSLFPR